MIAMALFLLLVGLMLLGFMGLAVVYAQLAQAQAAADAAALTGARQAIIRQIKVGGNTICSLAEIDESTATQVATQVWNLNISDSNFQTVSIQGEASPPSQPTRYNFTAQIETRISALALVGIPRLQTTISAEAQLIQECNNTLTGPVFSLPRSLPAGWPISGAEWIWNFPAADRNAPTGWPVYFVNTFTLPADQQVTVYVAADADYEVGIDNNTLITGSGPGIRSASIDLSGGPHMIWVKATNEQPSQPFSGPNPAGIVIGIRDDAFNTILVSRGNPVSNAGKPSSPDDWSSWSPPHPDWSVYVDPFYATDYLTGGSTLATYLQDVGFTLRTAADLQNWMLQNINSGRAPRTVVVMAQDIVPNTIASSASSSALIRQYLNAGGNILWMGNTPMYYQGQANGNRSTWGTNGQVQILGLPNGTNHWNANQPIQVTSAGNGYGLGLNPWWVSPLSTRANVTYCWLQPLATIANGGVAAWRMSYWPLPPDCNKGNQYMQDARQENAPGFIRIYDAPVDISNNQYLISTLAVAGQLAGWYRGQAP